MEVAGLMNLALVTSVNEPLDIIDEHWPPEVEKQVSADYDVPKVIVSLLNKSISLEL